ncbi:MAG: sulfate transporter CysZ [Magnetococcales bacterium]|nr:sulfate transporter CysZ [Magnetococcales bacterium]MBF0439241.1 sulfate transporter CysZ [Magnetococcales bacterium]
MKNSSLIKGASYLLQGIRLLTVPGLRQFVWIPLLLSSCLLTIGTWYALSHIWGWSSVINGMLPSWLHWMGWILMPLLFSMVGGLLFWSSGAVANLLGSPFNALLAEKVEIHLSGDLSPTPQHSSFMESSILPVLSEINKIVYYLTRAIPLLLLFLLPVINIAAPFLWILFSCWMMAFQYVDFPMSNHHMNDKKILAKLREKRLLSLGFGGATMVMSLIPFVNFLVMPAAVAGATALWVNEWKQE